MQEKLYTPEQVAQILQVHQFTVLKYIKQGKINASKIGRVYRIRESDLEEFLDSTSKKNSRGSSTVNNKNKNKTTQNFPASQQEAENTTENQNLTEIAEEENVDQSQETVQHESVDKVAVSEIENGDIRPKHGGQDTYYILR